MMAQEIPVGIHNRALRKARLKEKRGNESLPLFWYDADRMEESPEGRAAFERLAQSGYYSGILIRAQGAHDFAFEKFPRHDFAVEFRDREGIDDVLDRVPSHAGDKLIAVSGDPEILKAAAEKGLRTCFYIFVHDKDSLQQAVEVGGKHPFVLMNFRDPTNIPLELVIAELQHSETTLIKELGEGSRIEDVFNSMNTMEFGAEGFLFSPVTHAVSDLFIQKLEATFSEKVKLESAEIIETSAVGVGIRGCIDFCTMFGRTEGILVGSTSQGGFLCCPEVFEMPYMNKREFRINAGGIHAYVFGSNNRTLYMSELKAGQSELVVDISGNTRMVPVGRIKLEKRPLRLIRAAFASGEEINILLQDDWHVRIFSPEGLPLNITDLKVGSKVAAYKAVNGRHVGVPVNEFIKEN